MKNILLYIWQLPQNLIGSLLVKLFKCEKSRITHNGWVINYYFAENFLGGVSLGKYIIVRGKVSRETIQHENGHCKQSKYLGPLYLPVIGIYSAVFCNLWSRAFHKKWAIKEHQKWYYNRWTEKWADKLGGARREF